MRPTSTMGLALWGSRYRIPPKTAMDQLCEIAERSVAAQMEGNWRRPKRSRPGRVRRANRCGHRGKAIVLGLGRSKSLSPFSPLEFSSMATRRGRILRGLRRWNDCGTTD